MSTKNGVDDIKLKRDDSGITTMGIFDFLLNENSLDMQIYMVKKYNHGGNLNLVENKN